MRVKFLINYGNKAELTPVNLLRFSILRIMLVQYLKMLRIKEEEVVVSFILPLIIGL